MTDFIFYKILTAIIIFIIALMGGLFPALSQGKHRHNHVLLYGEYLARGIFLGIGLIHLLPEALESFNALFPDTQYPYIQSICALTILLLYLIEKGLTAVFAAKNKSNEIIWLPYVIIVMLSVHSLIEGAVLGAETTFTHYIIIAFAIVAHKAADGFALGISLPNSHFSKSLVIKLMLVFALLTPLGMFFGTALSNVLEANPGHMATAIFNAIASGTFIYIALNEACLHHDEEGTSLLYELIYFAVGLILMAIVAIWI